MYRPCVFNKAQFVFLILCAQVRNSVISFYSRAVSFSSTVTGKHTEDAAVGRGGENYCYGHKERTTICLILLSEQKAASRWILIGPYLDQD